eukprot:scaffold17927_cov67-Phaeocystis_antarctica.AAC.1
MHLPHIPQRGRHPTRVRDKALPRPLSPPAGAARSRARLPAIHGTGGCAYALYRAAPASLKARIMLRTRWFGMSVLLSSLAPVFGEVSLVRSHSEMAARSQVNPSSVLTGSAMISAVIGQI